MTILSQIAGPVQGTLTSSPTPPENPTTGMLWLRSDANVQASQDWRVYDDGTPVGISDPTDTPPWTPFTNGPGSLGAIPVLDASFVNPSLDPLTVTNACLRAPGVGAAHNAIQAIYNIGTPTTDTFASIVGFADWLNDDDSDPAGAGINIIIVSPDGTGPIAHCAADTDAGEQVAEFKIGLDNGGTAHVGSLTYHLDRLPGAGDRMALIVDTVARSWEMHFNGVLIPGMVCTLEPDGSGGEDVIVDGETITNLPTPYDFDSIFATGGPISCSDATAAYSGGVAWWALAESDYAPELATLWEYDGSDWVKRIEPDHPRADYPGRIAALAGAAGDVVGPGSSTAGHFATYGNTSGKLIADGGTLGTITAALTGKTTPIDADSIAISDSAASDAPKKVSLTNLKAFLKTYTDTLYPAGTGTSSGTNTGDETALTLGGTIFGAAGKTTPDDTDALVLDDLSSTPVIKKFTIANLKVLLKAYFDPLYYGTVHVPSGTMLAAGVTTSGTWVETNAGVTVMQATQSSPANTDYISIPNVPLGGTYTASVAHVTGTDCGQMVLSIDGSTVGSLVDGYGASNTFAVGTFGTGLVVSPGLHTVKIAVPTKGTGSNYQAKINQVTFIRTA